jgi:invasion protein IalB
MRRAAGFLFWILSLACLSVTRGASEEATLPAPTISPWMKFCFRETCYVDKSVMTDCRVIAGAEFMVSGESKGALKIKLPLQVNRERGVSIVIDQTQPILRPFDSCYPLNCQATYEAGLELIDQLKKGQTLAITAVDGDNSTINRILPLAGFAEAYDGPPIQLKEFKLVTGELQKELQKGLEAGAAGNPPEAKPTPHCSSQN